MSVILQQPAVHKLKVQLEAILDDYLRHDGWGHMEIDMRILTRQQKEIVIRAGKEYRHVIDFKNASTAAAAK